MKKILTILLITLIAVTIVSCTKKEKFSFHETKLSENKEYNSKLFYLNSLEFQVADPSVIYVDEGTEAGYFYAYGTSDDIRGYGIQSWRSKDLSNWEAMGVAFKPDFNKSWADIHYWAPEILYDREAKLYYMFYSANTRSNGIYQMSVAYSENPQGPFISPDNIRNSNGELLSQGKPVIDVNKNTNPVIKEVLKDNARLNAIDISPFIDPKTGTKYIYFSYYDSWSRSEIFGMEMKDWFTPKYETITQLTAVGYLTVDAYHDKDNSMKVAEGTINEGPFMYYHEDQYFMTLSVYGYTDEKYQVRLAVGDSPLGVYTKYDPYDGGTVIATDAMWDHMTSAGHHAFVTIGDELFIAYHTFLNRTDITEGRALAFDKVFFVQDGNKTVMHTNGPSYSVQPLPEKLSGYKNVASGAKVSANNTNEDSNTKYLTDGLVPYLETSIIPEYTANTGKSIIELSWDNFITARSILVYNSMHYEETFTDIEKITLHYKSNENGKTKKVVLENLGFDWDWHYDSSVGIMRPGGAVVVEFDDIAINKIEIEVNSVKDSLLSIPEIVVLGQDKDMEAIKSFNEYSFTNDPKVYPDLITEGKTIGTNNGLKTNFGYDLTHDDGTSNAYITQQWPFDQFAYFKDIYDTIFYVEAEFTVTNNKSYANDLYPKFGLTVSTTENTIFFYVDANQTYTQDSLGAAQRMLDNSDWDWDTTEQNVPGTNIKYRDGEYVKLAILRIGKEFYLIANDKLYIYYDNFNLFNDTYKAVPGFLSFNTEMKIKNYSATTDKSVIEEKLANYEHELNGKTMGIANGYKTTSGWDLTHDDGTSAAYMINSIAGDQYAYFRNFYDTSFTAETKITVLEGLSDPYPKFGITMKNNTNEFFFFIDSNTTYDSKTIGYVERNVNGDWDWGNSKSIEVEGIKFKNNEYTKLSLSRDGSTVKLLVNGIEIKALNDLRGFGENDKAVVGILTFTTSVKIIDYKITTK